MDLSGECRKSRVWDVESSNPGTFRVCWVKISGETLRCIGSTTWLLLYRFY